MALDKFEYLPGIIHELQDGGLEITETSTAPLVLVLGTASQGISGRKIKVNRSQESESRFGKEGTLIRGMYEAKAAGSTNTYIMRINTKSAILYGVGTDDQVANPTSIETLIRDGAAADLYSIFYQKPATLGPNAVVGRLRIKNVLGTLVYDSNPGGQPTDTGEVIVSGNFIGGADIGTIGSFVSLRDLAQDETPVVGEAVGAMAAAGPETFDLANSDTIGGSHVVYVDSVELVNTEFSISYGTGTAGVDELTVDISGLLSGGEVITIDYKYDADVIYNLRDGDDGLDPSKMKMYEALDEAYRSLESDEIDIVIPKNVFLDDSNVADGDIIVLGEDLSLSVGENYPVPGSTGDGLGLLHVEEYEGEFFYFWDIDDDGVAEIFPSVGAASSTTKISGEALTSSDFHEVNFAYQLSNFCFSLSVNDNEVGGVIGTKGPFSFSRKDVARWIGKEPEFDDEGDVIVNGTGLLGNKFMAGRDIRESGFFATESGWLPITADFASNPDIIRDEGGHMIDIGKYISITAMPLLFFNNTDETGTGYNANMASYYGGFYSTLPSKIAPTNKKVTGVKTSFRISKTKLNLLAKYHYIAIKQKETVLKISDSSTAARNDSDFVRLTTMRIVADAVNRTRAVADPYIGKPNTALSRNSLETGITRDLDELQKGGFIIRFEVRVTATVAQEIRGDQTVELVIVPAFELRKIRIITSLAKQ